MPKRTFWLVTGAALGAGSSLWAERKVRRAVEQAAARLQPDALVAEVGRSARSAAGQAGHRVRDAMASGRSEMERREEELWAELSARAADAPPHPPSGVPGADRGVGADRVVHAGRVVHTGRVVGAGGSGR